MSRSLLRVVAAIALVVATGALGYVIGHSNRGSVFTVDSGIVHAAPSGGTAYLGANEPLNREPTGFAYAFPAAVTWIDADGTIHDGSQRPPCAPYYRVVRVKRMEAVIFPTEGGYQGTVLWVHC
jgi:hypothetical protein